MDDNKRIDVCANCLHCRADENNEQVCAINYDTHARRCRAFAPKNDDVEKEHARNIAVNAYEFAMYATICGGVLITIVVLVGMAVGFEILGNHFVWALVATGSLSLVIAGVLYIALRLRRNSISQELRKELEAEARQ